MFRVEDRDGELVTCAQYVEIALSLMKRIPRAVRVCTEEGVELAIKVPPLVIRVGSEGTGAKQSLPVSLFNCAPTASGWN